MGKYLRKVVIFMKKHAIKCLFASSLILTSFTSCGAMEEPTGDYSSSYNYISESAEDFVYEPPVYNTSSEEYTEITENGFKQVKTNPLSTFSADVDTASYANIRRMINDNGGIIDTNVVRIEEMINYFDYSYETPTDKPFSVTTEMSDCPWNSGNKLLSIGVKGKEIETERVMSNIVFLLDVSGSMYSEDKLPLMTEAFCLLAENLTENDRVSIVTYAGADEVLLKGEQGNNYRKISEVLNSLEAGGSTNGAAGINTAYELAEKYFIEGGNNRVILATDGDLNVGVSSVSELEKLITEKRDSGVYLSVLGFGTGNLKDNKMETLADKGNGNYAYIDSIDEARKTLVEEMGGTLFTIAKDVKFQVEFNPAYVSDYRLIGYENRLLNDKDFYDDTKDAGEIGSGHTVTALYELTPAASGLPLKYQDEELPETDYTGEWLTVSVSYKEPDAEESEILRFPVTEEKLTDFPSEDMQFATCVAEFGMLLAESEYSENLSYENIIETLNSLDCVYTDKYKAEFVELVEKVSF